jgi:hypothetical protein
MTLAIDSAVLHVLRGAPTALKPLKLTRFCYHVVHECMQVSAVYWVTQNVAQKLCGYTEEDNEDAPVRGAVFVACV